MKNNKMMELLKSENTVEISIGFDGNLVEGYKGNKSATCVYTSSIKEFEEDEYAILIISENGVVNVENLIYAYNSAKQLENIKLINEEVAKIEKANKRINNRKVNLIIRLVKDSASTIAEKLNGIDKCKYILSL